MGGDRLSPLEKPQHLGPQFPKAGFCGNVFPANAVDVGKFKFWLYRPNEVVCLLNNLVILNANDANRAGACSAPIGSLKINGNKGFQRA